MNNKNILYVFILAVIVMVVWFSFNSVKKIDQSTILSFADCGKYYPVTQSFPRQCRTPDGRTFAEETTPPITYKNATKDDIVPALPFPGAVTGKEFTVTGRARGTWYFEASFPVKVLDKDGKVLFQGPATAQGDWMTTNFVAFKLNVKVPQSYIGPATIILEKDNPSGIPEKDASISFPITIEY